MSLLDFLRYSTSVRVLGYPREIRGITRRYRRCRSAWREHIDRCRSVIERAAVRCEHHRRAIVLGAGLLHDVPLESLSARFDEVQLVDIVHPLFEYRDVRRLKNVRRVTADITDTVADLYRVSDEPDLPLPVSRPSLFIEDPDVDLVVSLNLLSQLPCMPLDYLARYRAHPVDKAAAFARQLLQAHLDYLGRFTCPVVLITDIERQKIDMMNRVVERRDLLFGLPVPAFDEEWIWKLAPCPEADARHHYYRRVIARVT